jgi:murein DD-endopeptidase MepM/ murein hydrolase activator NlpD
MRTIGVRTLLTAAGLVAVLLMAACFLLGMRAAAYSSTTADSVSVDGAAAPDGAASQVVIERIGRLSGRLTRLESEALALAKRLGRVTGAESSAPDSDSMARSAGTQQPSGGPFVPLSGLLASRPMPTPANGSYAQDLSELEKALERIEDSLADLDAASADHQMADMAFPYRLPVVGRNLDVSSGYGQRRDPFTGRRAQHTGLDIPAPRGTPILASGGGRVRSAGYKGAYGYAVVIDHGDGLATLYGHASKLFVRTGDVVLPQQKIAAVGSSGRSTGPHLHFEVIRNGKRVEPTSYLASVLPDAGAP